MMLQNFAFLIDNEAVFEQVQQRLFEDDSQSNSYWAVQNECEQTKVVLLEEYERQRVESD